MTWLFAFFILFGSERDHLMDVAAPVLIDPMSCGVGTNSRGERLDRMTRWAPNDPMCMYFSIDNAYHFAHEVLWKANGGAIYGANVDCRGDLTADSVPCLVDITNKNFEIVDQKWIACTTLKHCGHYGRDPGLCCHVTK